MEHLLPAGYQPPPPKATTDPQAQLGDAGEAPRWAAPFARPGAFKRTDDDGCEPVESSGRNRTGRKSPALSRTLFAPDLASFSNKATCKKPL